MTDLDRYLADNPAMTARDWKGKGFTEHNPFDKYRVEPGEEPWDKLDRDDVRRLATSTKARFLSRSERMAAARDSGLVWDARTRSYRLRAEATPAPQEAARDAEGEGAEKLFDASASRPALAMNENANGCFCPLRASARSRGSQGDAS